MNRNKKILRGLSSEEYEHPGLIGLKFHETCRAQDEQEHGQYPEYPEDLRNGGLGEKEHDERKQHHVEKQGHKAVQHGTLVGKFISILHFNKSILISF